ncbi:extracellular solute-binding protein [Actinomadura keratinilytica]|jgi:multiple sugar transport system substrate-binding protein|uniref:ABC transporter substrate-binding protein n=1 Tax=Actinomadura keratinilytica TaxID=547461 RepID=A0ABP7Z4L2_9ACTN
MTTERIGISRRKAMLVGVVGAAAGIGGFLANERRTYGDGGSSGKNIELLMGEEISQGERRREIVRRWNTNNSDKRVLLTEMPGATDNVRAEVVALASTRSRAFDVVAVDVAWTAEVAASNYFDPFPENDLEDPHGFFPGVLKGGQYRGEQYTVPFAADAALLFYRKDLVGDDPLPQTFMEAVARGAEYKRDLGVDGGVGFVGQFADYEGLTVNILEAIWSNGGDPLEIDGNAENAIRNIVHSVRNSSILRDTDEQRSIKAFREGRAVFMRNWPYAYHQLFGDRALRDRMAFVALPWPSVLGGHYLGVVRYSDKKEAAKEFINNMARSDQQDELFTCAGYPPVRTSSYDKRACPDEGGNSEDAPPPPPDLGGFAAAVKDAMRHARLRPQKTWYSQYSRTLRRHVFRALSSDVDLDFAALRRELRGLSG